MILTASLAFPKPIHAEGRTVLSSHAYSRRKEQLWREQGHCCNRCHRPLASPRLQDGAHFHHLPRLNPLGISTGRGLGGGKRDDLHGELICQLCHAQAEANGE